jgi:septum site-determining protein MinD
MDELREKFDWVICDSPAGIERGATLAMKHADLAVVVTNPEVSSCAIPTASSGSWIPRRSGRKPASGWKSSCCSPATTHSGEKRRDAQGRRRAGDLSIPLLGIIPESEEVLKASNLGAPVTIANPISAPARAYADAARRLMGETVALTIPTDKRGLFGKLFMRRAA